MEFSVVVLTYNAGQEWGKWIQALKSQSVTPKEILVIDSSSTDDTVKTAKTCDLDIFQIKKTDFNHGGTRQLALTKINDYGVIVFFTQDAFLAYRDSLKTIVSSFQDESVGAAYGRQLPRIQAGYLESYERDFNYPSVSQKKEYDDRHKYGVKTPFISNSFAAYRIKALQEVGGFPEDVIMAEDMYVAAKMLMAGWSTYYCAEAAVYHSHDYSFKELFGRYFDTGVFHRREPWIQQEFGQAGGEGAKYALSEIQFLWSRKPFLIPYSIVRNGVKWLGYRMGLMENYLPNGVKRYLSMHKGYWD